MRSQGAIKQRRSLSQVFLRVAWPCEQVARKIEELAAKHVLEIGPGGGALTRHLARLPVQLTVVEKDSRFAEQLHEDFEQADHPAQVKVIQADFLKWSLATWIAEHAESGAIVGNIPYKISTDIVKKILDVNLPRLPIILLVQWEFAERAVAKPRSKTYGSFSVFCQLRARPYLLAKVDRGCFKPVPKVDSALLYFEPLELQSKELLSKTESICREAFNQRRKKLRSSLKAFLAENPGAVEILNLDQRAEDLAPEDFLRLGQFALAGRVCT